MDLELHVPEELLEDRLLLRLLALGCALAVAALLLLSSSLAITWLQLETSKECPEGCAGAAEECTISKDW